MNALLVATPVVGVPGARVARYTYEINGQGIGEIVAAGDVLLAHDLRVVPPTTGVVPPTTPEGGTSSPGFTLAAEHEPVCADFVPGFVDRVRAQLDGEKTTYSDIQLDLSWCTPFQSELAAALLAVPWGEIVSYGELAALAGRPGAARAAGSFCAQNRFALVMPCHRVVGAAGIGGYGSSGVDLKRRLLALEGVEL